MEHFRVQTNSHSGAYERRACANKPGIRARMLQSHGTHVKWLINNFHSPYSFPVRTPLYPGRPDLCTHLQIQECRLLGTLLGGTSNRGTVPLIAPPPPPPPEPPPSPSSAGSRSSGTWRLLILDTTLPIVALRHQSASSRPTSSRITRQPDITDPRASTTSRGFSTTRFHAHSGISGVRLGQIGIFQDPHARQRHPPLSSGDTRACIYGYGYRDSGTYAKLRPKDSCDLSAKQRALARRYNCITLSKAR